MLVSAVTTLILQNLRIGTPPSNYLEPINQSTAPPPPVNISPSNDICRLTSTLRYPKYRTGHNCFQSSVKFHASRSSSVRFVEPKQRARGILKCPASRWSLREDAVRSGWRGWRGWCDDLDRQFNHEPHRIRACDLRAIYLNYHHRAPPPPLEQDRSGFKARACWTSADRLLLSGLFQSGG